MSSTEQSDRYDIDVEDVEYLNHGGKPLMARVYRPRGRGPFPLIIDIHGGVWCRSDRFTDAAFDQPLARSGVVVAALDFRMPPTAGYPASLMDISYAIRWFKSRAAQWSSHADRIGLHGVSSGGHQAMLIALRPNDPRYSVIPLGSDTPFDERPNCVILTYPVIDPLARYRYVKDLLAGNDKKMADMAKEFVDLHERYWNNEDAMSEAIPLHAINQAKQPLPAVLYQQRINDAAHPRKDLDRFVAAYREAGGRLDLNLLPATPDSEAVSAEVIDRIIEFVHQEIPCEQ